MIPGAYPNRGKSLVDQLPSRIMRLRAWGSCVIALIVVSFRAGFGTGTAGADCFQLGGYNPPKCTTTAPKADNNQAAKPTDSSSPDKDQSENSSTGSGPADSGMTACQNQRAMPIGHRPASHHMPGNPGPGYPARFRGECVSEFERHGQFAGSAAWRLSPELAQLISCPA